MRAQIGTKPAAPKAPRKSAKDSLLLDTRTVAELWLAGEMPDARNRAAKRAPKGAYRSIVVTLADGFTIKAGSYLIDDAAAKAEVVRFARSRAMEQVFEARDGYFTAAERMRRASGDAGGGWQWIRLPDGTTRRTRACTVADVASVEFVPSEPAPASVQVGRRADDCGRTVLAGRPRRAGAPCPRLTGWRCGLSLAGPACRLKKLARRAFSC